MYTSFSEQSHCHYKSEALSKISFKLKKNSLKYQRFTSIPHPNPKGISQCIRFNICITHKQYTQILLVLYYTERNCVNHPTTQWTILHFSLDAMCLIKWPVSFSNFFTSWACSVRYWKQALSSVTLTHSFPSQCLYFVTKRHLIGSLKYNLSAAFANSSHDVRYVILT